MKGVYIFLANGYEPLEALAPMDILHRADVDTHFVTLPGADSPLSTQGYGINGTLTWDEFITDSAEKGIEALIFPGGLPGADNLGGNAGLMEIMKRHFDEGGLVCAICAAPARVLARNLGERLKGRRMTTYAGFEGDLIEAGAIPTGESVVVDGNVITAKGPGLAIDFGLAILDAIADHRIYKVVKSAMML